VPAHVDGDPAGFLGLAAMWLGMMSLMMAPSAWSWVRTLDRFAGAGRPWRVRGAGGAVFVVGYLTAWAIFSSGAALLQLQFLRAGLVERGSRAAPLTGAIILLAAGAYQFVAFKAACLQHCRSPIGYFLTSWRPGLVGGWRMGFGHGLFCVGCCWALMLTALAVGVMDWRPMAALAVVSAAEQVTAWGHVLRRVIGAALIAAGILRLG